MSTPEIRTTHTVITIQHSTCPVINNLIAPRAKTAVIPVDTRASTLQARHEVI